jgi:hypothetical protein
MQIQKKIIVLSLLLTVSIYSYAAQAQDQSVQQEFNEVFNENNGFDIVIGNPPYRQIQKFSETLYQYYLEIENFETFLKTGDLYCLFYEIDSKYFPYDENFKRK